jgi:hypothetical protein
VEWTPEFGQIELERRDRGCDDCSDEAFFQIHPEVYNSETSVAVSDYRPAQ